MDHDAAADAFEHAPAFTPVEGAASLVTRALEAHYQEILGSALEDGVITAEERADLERTASDLGLDRERLLRLEQAMIAAYESHHRVPVVERFEAAPSVASTAPEASATDTEREVLRARVRELEARVAELEEELRRLQATVNVEVDLTELQDAINAAREDPELVQRHVYRDPTLAAPYRDLYRIFAARRQADRQWCVAQALAALGEANAEQLALFEQHRPGGLIAATSGVTPAGWEQLLLHPEAEPVTGQIFGVVAPALLLGRVSTLRREGKLAVPDESTRQDPGKSTVSAVRALPWAASLLGMVAPPIHVDPSRDAGYVHLPAIPPVTVAGRRVLSGRTQVELAFYAGRHLTFYRPECFVRTLWSGVADLEELFLAALSIGNAKLPIAEDLRRRVGPVAAAIEPLLTAPQVDALRALYLRFVEEGGRTNLQRWSSSVEKTACRAGLLLCGDLATAVRVLAAEEGDRGPLAKDLLAFSVSDRYFALREQLGIAR